MMSWLTREGDAEKIVRYNWLKHTLIPELKLLEKDNDKTFVIVEVK